MSISSDLLADIIRRKYVVTMLHVLGGFFDSEQTLNTFMAVLDQSKGAIFGAAALTILLRQRLPVARLDVSVPDCHSAQLKRWFESRGYQQTRVSLTPRHTLYEYDGANVSLPLFGFSCHCAYASSDSLHPW